MATDGKTFLSVSGILQSVAANSVSFHHITGRHAVSHFEPTVQTVIREAGTISHLMVKVTANTLDSGNAVWRFRKNGADGNQIVIVPAGATGTFEDLINTDSVSAGDLVATARNIGGTSGNVTIAEVSYLYSPTTDTVSRLATCNEGGTSLSTDSVTRYIMAVAGLNLIDTESLIQMTVGKALTSQNLGIHVSANTRTTDTVLRTRINGVDGNQIITIGAGVIGWIEDLVNTDSIAAGDEYNYSITTSTGGGTITIFKVVSSLVSTTTRDGFAAASSSAGAATIAAGETDFWSVSGGNLSGTPLSEANAQHKAQQRFTFSDLSINVTANTITTDSTLKLRINGTDGNLAVPIPASTIGIFTDTTHTDTLTSVDDLVNIALVAGGTGTSMTYRGISLSTSNLLNVSRTVTEPTFEIAAAVTRKATFMRTLSETTTEIIDAVARKYFSNRSISEPTITISDTVARLAKVSRALSESFTIEDAVAYAKIFPRLVSESLEIDAIVARLAKVSRSISESFTVEDVGIGIKLTGVIFVRNVSESLTVVTSTVRRACRVLPFLHH